MKIFVALLLCVACGSPSDVAPPSPVAASPELRSLLRARHLEDLPDAKTLAAYPRATDELRELAWRDDRMMVRRRAAGALGSLAVHDVVAERALVELCADDVDPGVRAAAIAGLGRLDLAARAELRALVEAQVFAGDTRVAYAAVAALGGVEASRPVLLRVIASPAVAPAVRSLAQVRLGGEPLPAQPLIVRKLAR
jgi:hypothetical protein